MDFIEEEEKLKRKNFNALGRIEKSLKKIWVPIVKQELEQRSTIFDKFEFIAYFRKKQKDIHENAIKHGWYEEDRSFGDLIALVHTEASEALEEYRNGRGFNEIYYADNGKPYEKSFIKFLCYKLSSKKKKLEIERNVPARKPEGIPIELADVVIRVMDMCEHYGIDLWAAIERKNAYNRTRPHKHGGKVL